MAGDWIALRVDLADDPAIARLLERFEGRLVDADHVVGKLARLWSWADQQTVDGSAAGVTTRFLDDKIGLSGFCQALAELRPHPWLEISAEGIRFPDFARWQGETAKARMLATKRKQRQRSRGERDTTADPVTTMSRRERDMSVTKTGPPDRTGHIQEINQPDPDSGAGAREEAVRPGPARPGSNGSRPLRKGPERRNEILALMSHEPQPQGPAWVQRFGNTMFEVNRRVQPQMTGAEWQQQRSNVLAVGNLLLERADRNELAAELIELAIRKRQSAGIARPWAAWQALVNQRLKAES